MAVVDRIEALKALLAQNPGDTFAQYGLAMEYSRMGQIDEALAGFDAVLAANPDYVAAYYHAGQTLERSSREQDARLMYARGIAVADRLGDMKTRSELQAALDILG